MMDQPRVRLGTHVIMELIDEAGDVEEVALDIVADAQADFDQGLLGVSTPLAQALLGQRAGTTVDYRAGGLRHVKIKTVAWSELTPADASAQRQQNIERARRESDRTNALNFASTFNSKWGAYDPAGIEDWESTDK